MQLLSIINFTAAIQGLFLSYLLVNSKVHAKESRILALLVFVMSVGVLGAVLGLSGYYKELPHLIRVGDPLVLLFGPLLYFYIYQLTQGNLPKKYALHLLPFLIYLITLIPFYLLSGAEKVAFVEKVFLVKLQKPEVVFIQAMRFIHILIYVIISLFLLKKFRQFLKENYSAIEKLNLDKSAFLLKLFIAISLLQIVVYVVSTFVPIDFVLTNNIISLAISGVIYALAYTSWNRQGSITTPTVANEPVKQVTANGLENPLQFSGIKVEEKKRSNYFLSDEQYTLLASKLEILLQKDKVFMESELSLTQLSEKLGIPSYQTSELINRKYKEPFFDLINRHRIEEVKKRLNDPTYYHFSILGIAMDCGFNTKSSFNAAFKKFSGLTPSEFRKKQAI